MHLRIEITPPRGSVSHSITVEQEHALLGRATFSEVRLPFAVVSSRHLEVERRQGRWFLRDVGSSNGTMVDGARLKPGDWMPVQNGMSATIVDLDLRFHYVQQANAGLTLAQSGTLVRRLVLAAADKVVDDDAAFIEVIEGTGVGGRVYLPDDLESTRVGHGADRPLAGVTPPLRIGRDDDRFTVEEGPADINGVAFQGPATLESGDRIRVGASICVFFDPLEELLDDFGGARGNDASPAAPIDTVTAETAPASSGGDAGSSTGSRPPQQDRGEDGAQDRRDGDAGPQSAPQPKEETGALPAQSAGEGSPKKERGLGVAEIALIVLALVAFAVAGVVLWVLFG